MPDEIAVEEVELRLTKDAERYTDKAFALVLTDPHGEQITCRLDGIQIADLLVDANAAGMPDGSKLAEVASSNLASPIKGGQVFSGDRTHPVVATCQLPDTMEA